MQYCERGLKRQALLYSFLRSPKDITRKLNNNKISITSKHMLNIFIRLPANRSYNGHKLKISLNFKWILMAKAIENRHLNNSISEIDTCIKFHHVMHSYMTVVG